MFEIAPMRIRELTKLVDISPPVLSRKFKSEVEPAVVRKNNRISALSPELIEKYLTERGHQYLYRNFITTVSSTVGGTGKTSGSLSLLAAARRITSRERALCLIDTDSQASATTTMLGQPIPDTKPVLVDLLEKRCSIEDVLTPVGDPKENIWVLGSNLNNVYLDKALSKPTEIRKSMREVLTQIFEKLGEGTKIFVDTPPQLSSITSSTICAMSDMKKAGTDCAMLMPIRSDLYSLKGARISMKEKKEVLAAFSLEDIPTICFLASFDRRLKVSVDVMRMLLEDELLKDHVSPVVVRSSSELSKATVKYSTVFSSGEPNTASADYMDLLLNVLGYEPESMRGNA